MNTTTTVQATIYCCVDHKPQGPGWTEDAAVITDQVCTMCGNPTSWVKRFTI